MKVVFRPRQFRTTERASNIFIKGVFGGLGIDFLAVMSRLYQMPFLWFSEGTTIELDFGSENLILKALEDKGEDFHAEEVIEKIPLKDLVSMSVPALRDKYIRAFAANLAEHNFGMPKTAKAIRERWHPSLISEFAAEEGHPILAAEIINLLFRNEWGIKTSYERKTTAAHNDKAVASYI